MKSTTGNQLRITNRFSNTGISSALVFLSCFFFAFILGSFMLQSQGAKAVTGLGLVTAPSLTLSADAASVNINPIPTANNGMALGSSTLTASTNVPTGYNLTLSATSNATIPPINGTIANPVALTDKTWGYALTNSGTSGAVGVTNGFDTSYTVASPNPNSKWANPTAAATVKRTNASASGDTTNVYYGAKVDMNTPSGTYSNTVTYTATANITDIPTPGIISVTPSSGSTAGGTAVQIVGTGFTVSDESVTTAVTVGGNNCTGVTISSNTPSAGQDTIYCTVAAHAAGAVNVAVTTWKTTATSIGGYTYAIPANVTFVSPNQASTIAGSESGPAFTVVGTGFTGATEVTIGGTACSSIEVVSDTQIFCKASNAVNTAGLKAVVVLKGAAAGSSTANVTYSSTNYPTLQGSDAYANCSTTAKLYRDTRDSQLYYVKRMPDNKCWMVDNLKYANYGDLSQEAGKYLTVDGTSSQSTANSNVAKYVDPGANNYCMGNTGMSTNTNTRCGLMYNWYTATNGTGTYAQSTAGTNVTGSICPANFRLPSAMSNGTTATSNGTSYNAADIPVLNASMNAGSLTTGSLNGYYTGWQPSGAWGGVFSGYWHSGFVSVGSYGYIWSSTAHSASSVRYSSITSRYINAGESSDNAKYHGFPVRCVMSEPAKTGDDIQTVSMENCPATRARVRDARDGATYWIRKVPGTAADGRALCWMETNLAYAGGGTNTYGDATPAMSQGSASANGTYTDERYYIPTGSNRTTGTADPSASTDGTGQYGYLYNWCAAMNGQSAACSDSVSDQPNQSVNGGTASTQYNICPRGWRLPTGGYSSEFYNLNNAINNGSYDPSGLLANSLYMYNGDWGFGSFNGQGSDGRYWSSTVNSTTIAWSLYFISTGGVYPASGDKQNGYAIRCVAV